MPKAAAATFPYPHRTVAQTDPKPARVGRRRRPVPADFTTYAPSKTIDHLCRHYGAGEATVKRWRDEAGVKLYDAATDPRPPQPRAPVPVGFRDAAPMFSDRELGRRYGRDHKTIRRWREECGLTREKRAPVVLKRHKGPKAHHIRLTPGRVVLPAFKNTIPPPLAGREQDAAQHLRRFFSTVHHCNEAGRFDPKGDFWRVGGAVLAPAEMVAKARGKGWRADSWMEIAA